MPHFLDDEPLYPSAKRRRVTPTTVMARRRRLVEEPLTNDIEGGDSRVTGVSELTEEETQPSVDVQAEVKTSDREELMECIKRGQKTKWIPTPGFQALCEKEEAAHDRKQPLFTGSQNGASQSADKIGSGSVLKGWDGPGSKGTLPLAPSEKIMDGHVRPSQVLSRSNTDISNVIDSPGSLSTSPPSWILQKPPLNAAFASPDHRTLQTSGMEVAGRPRAPSLGSSFVMRVPTSPLVYATNSPDVEFPLSNPGKEHFTEDERKNRRKTLPASSFHEAGMFPMDGTPPNYSRPLPPTVSRRSAQLPHQMHQPRRSLTSFTFQSKSNQQSPPPQSTRRFSLFTEPVSRRRSSMVGSFEESILRGRMSSPASKPFEFVAQIGVMGKGNCPSSLKCPAHVTVPFQAVFYSYPSSQYTRTLSDDAPSPYVGTIDLEQNLKNVQLGSKKKKQPSIDANDIDNLSRDPRAPENTAIGRALARDAQMQRPRSASPPRIVLGGAYRVPQQGQLQIIIKNDNKTAVKLFLVPYDLTGMEPGTKTFVRQRSYSFGSMTEDIVSVGANTTDVTDPFKDKNILRYLIHIRFCCPAKGRYYLFDNIRVVFANRVPDGKEKLRNEIQLPEPKFSSYRPSRTPTQHSRQSSMVDLSPIDSSPGIGSGSYSMLLDELPPRWSAEYVPPSIPEETPANQVVVKTGAIPFHLVPKKKREEAREALPIERRISPSEQLQAFEFPDLSHHQQHGTVLDRALFQPLPPHPERALSPVSGFLPSKSTRASPVPWHSTSTSSTRSFSPAPLEVGDGLLSKQFKSLSERPRTPTTAMPETKRDTSVLDNSAGHTPQHRSVRAEDESNLTDDENAIVRNGS